MILASPLTCAITGFNCISKSFFICIQTKKNQFDHFFLKNKTAVLGIVWEF